MSRNQDRAAQDVNRALFVKNLSFNVAPEQLFELFGQYGRIRQIRQGITKETRGSAFVVYDDVQDAKLACDKLNGFNFLNRYLVVQYHDREKLKEISEQEPTLEERRERLETLKREEGIE